MSDQQTPVDDAPTTQAPDVSQTPTAETPDSTPPAAEFTQADVDRVVKERLAREREKYADYNDLKAAAAKLAELEEAQLSEQEKLQKKLEQAEQARQQAETTARTQAIESALIAAAAKLGFNDPADAFALVDHGKLEFSDSGKPTNAAELVETLAEQRPYLIKQQRQPLESFNPSGAGGPIKETDAQRRARLYGGGGHIFDPLNAANNSGGVIWPKGMPGIEE